MMQLVKKPTREEGTWLNGEIWLLLREKRRDSGLGKREQPSHMDYKVLLKLALLWPNVVLSVDMDAFGYHCTSIRHL